MTASLPLREIGTLWVGGPLSWFEQLCLASFVDAGQPITLFHYEPIPNVPKGVTLRDGREVIDTNVFLRHRAKDSLALFADRFRLHMIRQNPGMVWVDSDVYCHQPLRGDQPYVMGFELPGKARVNNAVLGLPANSDLLAQMIAFTEDDHPIPPFLKPARQQELRAAADAGQPVHISDLPWGTWGPLMLTHFVGKLGLMDKVQPLAAYYPVPFTERLAYLGPADLVRAELTKDSTLIHLWASNKRELGAHCGGVPPRDSWLAQALHRHSITPAAAPIRARGQVQFDTALLDEITAPITRFADAGGGARGLALAAHARFGCTIDLIDMMADGNFATQPQPWVADYRRFLTENGVPETHIREVRRPVDLRPAGMVAMLGTLCAAPDVRPLLRVLVKRGLAETGLLVTDLRKGAGIMPWLGQFGTPQPLGSREEGDTVWTRTRFQLPQLTDADRLRLTWRSGKSSLTGPDGFVTEGDGYALLFRPGAQDTLVVTFDNLDMVAQSHTERKPWGYDFVTASGWSLLSAMAPGWTWYRDPFPQAEFDRLRDEGFFSRFQRVIFYGASMGGYAAGAFSAACPGADVVAINPQSTLDRRLVPWERRYRKAWDRDFSGPYGDAAIASQTARKVTVLYDPHEPLDRAHADRFTGDNVLKLRAPWMGHRMGSAMAAMGILSGVIREALAGTLTQHDLSQRLRNRHALPRFQRELFDKALKRHGPDLAARVARHALTRSNDPFFRAQLARLGSPPAAPPGDLS